MGKSFTKRLFLVIFYLLVIGTASAQTITVGAVDPGPYGQGSSISVPFNVTGCITASSNVYTLQLSDAAGNFGSPTNIGTYTGFYATFVNGVIPNSVTASANYKVRVVSSIPVLLSSVSASFTINAVAGIKSGASSNQINPAIDPEVFGFCNGANRNYIFTNTSDGGNPATATFFNELTQASEGTIPINGTFAAKTANYTVTVKTILAGIVGTKSYQLINNVANNSFTITGNGSVCLGAGNVLEYNVVITGNNGIQNNYPGLRYNIKWGDNSTSTYTLCEIVAANGKVGHAYTSSSCGNVANNQKNVFQIDIQPTSPYCTNITQPVTTYAKVLAQPQNRFVAPIAACLGSPVIFTNNSVPGDDPNSTTTDCRNIAATYTWLVDGVIIATGRPFSTPFVYTFTSSGNHDVTLRFENNNGLCDANDLTKQVCVQKSPTPNFTIPLTYCLATGPLTPVNTSVVDEVCNTNTTYTWNLVGGPATGVSFTANAKTPNFNFTQIGVYKFRLDITTLSCGTVTGPTQTIVVNDAPTAVLSPDANQCGKGVTLSFDPTAGSTKATLTGTAQPSATTYVWTVTSAAGGTFAFANGTTANSQYPSITFNDYDVYTVTATHTNGCGAPASNSQKLTFVAAPTVSAGPPQNNICEGTPVILTGTPGVGGLVTAVKWTSPTGGVFSSPNSPNTTYTPNIADINAGQVLLTYTATTSLANPCNQITSTVLITLVKKATVTSVNTQSVCSGAQFTYNITSANPTTTFSWAASLTSGTASGFNATGSGATINDIITNNTNANAVVTYTITPTLNGCPGTPFQLTLTVGPLSIVTATAVSTEICSNQPANISLSGSIPGTTYTWKSTADTGITGNIDQTIPFSATSIQDVLVNNSALPGTVTYTITPYNGTCPGVSKQVVITVKPLPKPSLPGPDDRICAQTFYKFNANDPSPGMGKWRLTSPQTGVTFDDDTKPNTTARGLVPGQTYTFGWAITAAATCPSNEAFVTITNDLQTVPGITTGATAVCAGSNSGTVLLQGYVGNILRWEQSIDGGVNWTTTNPNNTASTQTYSNLTRTTQYRAIVQSGLCVPPLASTATTITVNQPPVMPDAGPPQTPCNVTFVNLHANSPLPFTGTWILEGPPIPGVVIADPSNPQTRVTGLIGGTNYIFRWTINGALPCNSPFATVTITDLPDVPPSFTQTKTEDCGEYDVQFTNTSPQYLGVIFLWDFGDGSSPSIEISPLHHFKPDPSGADIKYIVKLTTTINCTARPPFETVITVHPATPAPSFTPSTTSGCGKFSVTLLNTSKAAYKKYTYVLRDENGVPIKTILDPIAAPEFNIVSPVNPQTYTITMTVEDFCGNTGTFGPIPISVAPIDIVAKMYIKDNVKKGCFPLQLDLVNLSSGGQSFRFHIKSTDGLNTYNDVILGGNKLYSPPKPGIYDITIIASSSSCGVGEVESTEINRIVVYDVPTANFQPDKTIGKCDDLEFTFTNTTVSDAASQASDLSYDWDFGDGTVHSTEYTNVKHTYATRNTPYTVTLTVTNPNTGCKDVKVLKDWITVFAKPEADFTASPGFTTAIPNYRFTFTDATKFSKSVQWNWTFGDGQTATGRNVSHTYGDVGKFDVTLNITDENGCTSTIKHQVEITGIPGFLYLPNAFQPSNGATDLQKFTAKGSGIAKWQLQIFNNWGQLIWQTTTLGGNGQPVEGWDGAFKGAPVQQGVYIWQASATFINGTEWKGMSYNGSLPKRSGYIHLIR
ncbi:MULTISPECIES: PKD domain-containing protein [unclassified Mucilaginibacter]|uniref:PKD domain-containing protein n=1 Tax=unclassified Mucilaginibacter TaxID=2617802 RepID=UPI002AC91C58|nr:MULTISPECIES: PKD domain-containing protein [unclassified Mucilaginibacter]MEB0261354.1 PKD domain-containing protein [Mucilaginibacter sp. 10I4]MEB0278887.1 PKD domain-containing protein [Mucilaginibacter sp. 10B2]MEB0299747.1 PKD domain-containing protein [Mucilaginibacter sp. 5C4]WPX22069.1 PKD domain-containing protein [Mucilaginibacter sp. 5C4]